MTVCLSRYFLFVGGAGGVLGNIYICVNTGLAPHFSLEMCTNFWLSIAVWDFRNSYRRMAPSFNMLRRFFIVCFPAIFSKCQCDVSGTIFVNGLPFQSLWFLTKLMSRFCDYVKLLFKRMPLNPPLNLCSVYINYITIFLIYL